KQLGELAEESKLYTFESEQLAYITSLRAEQIVAEVTAGRRLRGPGKASTSLAILCLLNACFEAFYSAPEGEEAGVLWRTATAAEPKSRYKQKLLAPAAKKRAVECLEAHGYIKFYKGG